MSLILSLLPLAAAGQIQIAQAPRLRTILPNGVLVLVERRAGAKDLVVDLFAASRGTDESPQNNGRRHLLEHIEALGVKGDLDTRLETAGAFLVARTTRDSIGFEMLLRRSDLPLALSAIKEIVTGTAFDAKAIKREANLISEEAALRAGSSLASTAAWSKAYGPAGVDPLGNQEVIEATTPADLEKLRAQTFASNNLTVIVSGDVDVDSTTKAVKDALGLLPSTKQPANQAKAPQTGFSDPAMGSVSMSGPGEYRAAPVPGFRSPVTAATLAAALALATELDHAQVIYTPSSRPGLIMLGITEDKIGTKFNQMDAAAYFEFGRRLCIRWVESRLADPEQAAAFRGMLMCQVSDVRPETMLENLQALKFEDFRKAFDLFKKDGIVVEGSR